MPNTARLCEENSWPKWPFARTAPTAPTPQNLKTPAFGMPLAKEDYEYFNSGVGIPWLSNFAPAEFTYEGYTWPTAEHCFQALFKVRPEHRHRFAVGGDLADLLGLKLVFPERDYEKKRKHYGAKGKRPEMPGIVAKMAVRPDIARKLGIGLTPMVEDDKHKEYMCELFRNLLLCKYRQNEFLRSVIVGTGKKTLVEFSRGAEREAKKGKPPLWTGMVVNGEIVGQNLQGELQMSVRSVLNDPS